MSMSSLKDERSTRVDATTGGRAILAKNGSATGAAQLSDHDAELIRSMATLFIDVVRPFAVAMARHIHEQEHSLGALDDADAVEATRASCEGNIREIFSMLRAGLPATVQQTPVQALEYARFLRRRGAGYGSLVAAYQHGVAMFRCVLAEELPPRVRDDVQLATIAHAADDFLFTYIGGVLERLLHEYELDEGAWHPAASDGVLADPASAEAARRFRARQMERGEWLAASPEQSRAHADSERVLERFVDNVERAAADPEVSRRLALAETTVEVVLADDPDLAVTLLLDRTPIEVVQGGHEGAVRLHIASFDLEQLWSEDFRLPMAIATGRVGASGPVREFLRVLPILVRHQTESDASPSEAAERRPPAHREGGPHDDDGEPSGFDPGQVALLDQAADYELHHGAMGVSEERPGDFWSVECIDVYKAFGRNRVLNGLNLGIPDGMITVILGPSGTGKSVLIKHLIGLMFPDQGDILVHGRSVPGRRRSELFEMRREFGILFQDGALFGSMNLYDNVAFPLREQTSKSEDEIRQIVEQRIEEVGLSEAVDRMPSELSGGMKKRAGFARALVMEPKIVMFDEPDSGLDPVRTALLCDLIRKVHGEHGGTYIVITHDIASARRLGQYIAVLWKGRIVESGDAEQMFNSENTFVRQFLTGASAGPLGME